MFAFLVFEFSTWYNLNWKFFFLNFADIILLSAFLAFKDLIYEFMTLGQGQTAPWGQKFFININLLSK